VSLVSAHPNWPSFGGITKWGFPHKLVPKPIINSFAKNPSQRLPILNVSSFNFQQGYFPCKRGPCFLHSPANIGYRLHAEVAPSFGSGGWGARHDALAVLLSMLCQASRKEVNTDKVDPVSHHHIGYRAHPSRCSAGDVLQHPKHQ
jgi:hypothetical protein